MTWLGQWREHRQPWQKRKWLALDIETNGLNPEQDGMLSLAWVPIYPPCIALDQSRYHLVHSDIALNQSAVVHRLSQEDIASGRPLREVIEAFIAAADGHYLVGHHLAFDWAVLQRALYLLGIKWRPSGRYCTLHAEKKRLERHSHGISQGALTLAASRERYGLDAFVGHHALQDAIACAELFLAQVYLSTGGKGVSARSVLNDGR